MGAVAASADEDEGAVGEPASDHPQPSLPRRGRGVRAAVLLAVEFGRPTPGDEDGPWPRTPGAGEADPDDANGPRVARAAGDGGVAGTDGVAVAGLAVDLRAALFTDGSVADERDEPGGE